MKRPAFQFYPADWRKDVELQSCCMAAQGLWINALCLAHECEPYGHLTINGKPMTPAQLGRQVGLSAKEAEALIAELIETGVARRTDEGAIYSKRMVADEDLRNRRAIGGKDGAEHGKKGAEAGSKGGRPKHDKGVGKGGLETPLDDDLKPPPSSSSSSSPSGNTPIAPKGADLFAEFWVAYPKKVGKDAAERSFAKRKPSRELLKNMLEALDAQKQTEQWRRSGGQYIPHPSTWLNEGRWKDGEALEDQRQETFV